MSQAPVAPLRWRPPPLIRNPFWRWTVGIGVTAFLIACFASLEINWARLAIGVERGWAFLVAFAQPDFTSRWRDIAEGIAESAAMTVLGTIAGIAISIPVAIGAARNLVPLPVYLVCRAIVGMSRTFPELIIAIILVALFGFGPFAGFLTLAFATIGFYGKLLAEEIEGISKEQMEAITATGATWWQRIVWAVTPQVKPRMIGLGLYRLDINFRESAVIGVVGAGGIGDTLKTSFDRYEYDSASAILIIIIGIVLATEYMSGFIRKRYI